MSQITWLSLLARGYAGVWRRRVLMQYEPSRRQPRSTPSHCTMGKCTKVGQPQKLAFQQWLYYLEEPCFVNISAKTDLTSTFNIRYVDSWPTKFPLCIVKLLFSFGLVPVISWWDGPCVIPCHGQTLSGLSTRLFDRDLGYYLDQQTLCDHI